MAKAVGRRIPVGRESPPANRGELIELATRLEDLARAQDDARGAINASEPNYAPALERLFLAVARLNPLHAADAFRTLAQSPGTLSR